MVNKPNYFMVQRRVSVLSAFAGSTPKQKAALEDAGMKIHNLHTFFFLAYIEICDLIDMIDEEHITGVYLHKYKKMVERFCNDYVRHMRDMYEKKPYSLLYDFGMSTHTRLERDLQIFRFAFKNHMLNTGIKYQDLIAQLEVCIALADFSVDLYDKFFEKYRKEVGYDISVGYRWMRIDKVSLNLKRISSELGKRVEPNDIDFSKSEQCQMAYQVIMNKLLTGDLIEDAALNALKLNKMGDLIEEQ